MLGQRLSSTLRSGGNSLILLAVLTASVHVRAEVSWVVEVLTADVPGTGSNNTLYITLKDTRGNQTPRIALNDTFRQGEAVIFDLRPEDTASLRKTLDLLGLEHDNSDSSDDTDGPDWYVDSLTVQRIDCKGQDTFVFPVNRLVELNTRYELPLWDTALPRDERFPQQRELALNRSREVYTLSADLTQPAYIETLPPNEQWSTAYAMKLGATGARIKAAVMDKIQSCPASWSTLQESECIFTAEDGIFPRPNLTLDHWLDDAWFGSQRLTASNPLQIRLATAIPAKLDVTEAELLPFLEGKTLSEALGERRLYVCDLALMEPYRQGSLGRTNTAPIALFFVSDSGDLLPIAIQLFQQPAPDNPVFFPSDDPVTWTLAKMWYNEADSMYLTIGTHLYLSHLLSETFLLATHRELAPNHPVFRLLKPSFLFLIRININARNTFFDQSPEKPGLFSTILAIGSDNSKILGNDAFQTWRLDVEGTLPEALKDRGVDDKASLPGYHYRDDALLVYKAIKVYVRRYLALYYEDDATVAGDAEIQSWAQELARPRSDGGFGVQGMPASITSRKTLRQVVTAILFLNSAHHASVNFPVWEDMGFLPNYPNSLEVAPPTDKSQRNESDIVANLPPIQRLLMLSALLANLDQLGPLPLGEPLGSFIVDPPAVNVGEKFREDLAGVQSKIEARNARRAFPYKYLLPSNIPASIGI